MAADRLSDPASDIHADPPHEVWKAAREREVLCSCDPCWFAFVRAGAAPVSAAVSPPDDSAEFFEGTLADGLDDAVPPAEPPAIHFALDPDPFRARADMLLEDSNPKVRALAETVVLLCDRYDELRAVFGVRAGQIVKWPGV